MPKGERSPRFQHAVGWHTENSYIGPRPGFRTAWAANFEFAEESSSSGFPEETLAKIPRNGIVIVAIQPRPYGGETEFPTHEWPLQASDGYFVPGDVSWDNQPREGVSRYQIDTWLESRNQDRRLLNVMVWVGSPHPDAKLVRQIDNELERLKV